jgi:TetR/AcrR family transcriptional repressor of mexJK operon
MAKQATARIEVEGAGRGARAGESSKRAAILAAASRVFVEQGYGAASMDAIARVAGVSKQTIYSHFGGKEALFEAIIRDKCGHLLQPLFVPEVRGADPVRLLTEIAERFLALVLASGNIEFFRVIVAECRRFPELADAFYRAGPSRAAEDLAEYLKEMDRKGTLAVPDPLRSARLFFSLFRGDLWMRKLLGIDPEDLERDARDLVRLAVGAFVSVHAPARRAGVG